MEERKNVKCNGFKNWDTWAVVVNLENDYNFYTEAIEEKEKWTSLLNFKNKYKYYMVDRINWAYVSAKEIKEWYNDLIN